MGAIEELIKWENKQGMEGCEEKIFVSVRLRPLNEKEITTNEAADWECINETTILYRNSLREGSRYPSAYTFDRVFGGGCSTRKVYDEGAKEIALSVVRGVNSSIFAYGQTSSGKTYTMIGITEYTVADIFDYIHEHEERAFILKFSAIEIYNEAVRDLLSTDDTPLRLLDDPEKGTVIKKVTEETLRDQSHFKELLSICEAQRRIGETSMNDKSSRSHQIIRLTIESSAREFLGKGNLTTLAASVNLVDLAGSERASQALSAGTRLKEGCHINRSLLTLGTVIRKLSQGRNGHINYRDSKLTRILQPSLGGNARTAIICNLSPARSHVEQSRNALLFACCAKEVTTKAQVNVVMSDKALVKHLQKELERLENELKTPAPTSSTFDYVALLRKKDLQIQKMEEEIREISKERNLALSRVEELLLTIENNKNPKESELHARDAWEDGRSDSEAPFLIDAPDQDSGVKNFGNPHYSDMNNRSDHDDLDYHQENTEDHVLSDDYCKEVQCIEQDLCTNNLESLAFPTDGSERMHSSNVYKVEDIRGQEMTSILTNGKKEVNHQENEELDHRLQHKTNNFVMSPKHDEPSPKDAETSLSGSGRLKLIKCGSCREDLISSSLLSFERAGQFESTPLTGFEKEFSGRPLGSKRTIPPLNFSTRLSRNDSRSSIGTAIADDLRAQNFKDSADDDITSINTFVADLKEMAQLHYEKQHGDGQDMGPKFEKNVKEIGLDSMQIASPVWKLEFRRQQMEILELWQTCNVPLVHRTYFFILFKGDPTDAIYMEVELRRLYFLKETFFSRTQARQSLTLAESMRALHLERDMLIKMMRKRLSEEERNLLYRKWGVSLNSKRRKLQLIERLWRNSKDLNYVAESAAIVAKLIKFSVKQGQAFTKEMFGLSFTPIHPTRVKSSRWKNSAASLL